MFAVLRGIRPSVLVTCVAFVLGSVVTARQALPADAGTPPPEWTASSEDPTSFRTVVFEGQVLEPDGAPAEGAVVISTAGGKAVTGTDGAFRLPVLVPPRAEVTITAFGSTAGAVASTAVGPVGTAGTVPVGTLGLARGGACTPSWLPTFGGQPGTNNTIEELVVFDDGGGPSLYAAGNFNSAGGIVANRIVQWDGTGWASLGSGAGGTVLTLAVFDDGAGAALYAGGLFSSVGGVNASRIARWNGTTWSALGSGLNDVVRTLTVFDDGGGPALYAGGDFTTAGGVSANRIARWDGTSWSALGSGTNNGVNALTVFDDGNGEALYAGGTFTTAGGTAASRIAKWDGTSWSDIGGGTNNAVYALAVYDDGVGAALHAGGAFTTAGGAPASRAARWDGAAWSALGSGLSATVLTLAVHDDGGGAALYAGGDFTTAGGAAASHIARWDGLAWSPLGAGVNTSVRALAAYDDGGGIALYPGGGFTAAGSVAASRIAKWDGAVWSALGDGINGTIESLEVFDDGGGPALYVGGSFTSSQGVPLSGIGRWDGASWSALGSGLSSVVSMTVFDDGGGPALYAGTTRVSRWDGSTWTAVGGVMNQTVRDLFVYDGGSGPELYAGGFFTTSGGTTVNHVARWDGSTWTAVGGGVDNFVYDLEAFDDGGGMALYAGGHFTTAGGVSANRIAKWDGTTWSPLGSGLNNGVRDMAVFDDGGGAALYACGHFTTAGGASASFIAKWDGATWFPLGSGVNGFLADMEVFDDGGGPALYAAGGQTVAGGVPSMRVSRWDGTGWSALGGGTDLFAYTLKVFDDRSGPGLYVGGLFGSAVDSGDSYLARWGCPDLAAPSIACPADPTVECAEPAGAVVMFEVIAVDDHDPAPALVCVPPSGSTFLPGTTTVSCTATDFAGNVSMCSFDVTVEDTTLPDVVCPLNITVECTDPGGEVVTFSPTATDLCDPSPSVVAVPPSGSIFALGTTIVTVTATDGSGNQSMCTFSVVVEDTTDPVVTCPGNMMVECAGGGTQVNWSASASDACDPAPALSCSPPSGSLFGLGTTTVTCTATDASGNAAMCSFDVTVVDTTDPSVTCPADVFLECADPGGEVVSFSVSATDGCDPAPGVSCVPASGSLFAIGTTTVTCTATDASGNTGVCTFDVTLSALDTAPPSISCPTNMTVPCTSPDGAVVTFTTTASDACDPSPLVVCSPPSGSLFPFGTTPVSCTATDAAGNSAPCGFSVTVQDTVPPVVHCPPSQSVPAGTQAFWSASATDNCDGPVAATCSPPSGSFFPAGSTTVTCMATDSSGNTGSCTFTVTGTVSTEVPALGPGWVALLAMAALGLGLTLRRQL